MMSLLIALPQLEKEEINKNKFQIRIMQTALSNLIAKPVSYFETISEDK